MIEHALPSEFSIEIPPDVEALIRAGTEARERVLRELHGGLLGYVPSDYPLAYQGLAHVRAEFAPGDAFCEWGCGLGVIVAMAAGLGFEAHGIEIQEALVEEGRAMFEALDLGGELHRGSFIPDDYSGEDRLPWNEQVTVLDGAGAVDEVEHDIEDFDLIYAFPWPGEEELYLDLFEQRGAPDALLLTYHGPTEGLRLHGKSG